MEDPPPGWLTAAAGPAVVGDGCKDSFILERIDLASLAPSFWELAVAVAAAR